MRGLKVLVTAAGTREPIDPVRYVGNRSSGKMGYSIAQAAAERGAEVTLVTGPSALTPPPNIKVVNIGNLTFSLVSPVCSYYCLNHVTSS